MMTAREDKDREENEEDQGIWDIKYSRAEEKVFFADHFFFFLRFETKRT